MTVSLISRARCSGRSIARWLAIGLLAMIAEGAFSAEPDASMIIILKGQRFEQTGPTIASLLEERDSTSETLLGLEAFVKGTASDSLVSGTLQIPGGTIVPLEPDANSPQDIRHEYQAESLLDLDAARPNGTYTFSVVTKNEGTKNVSLCLTNDAYPNVPVVTNYPALQTIIHTNATVVKWASMTGGTANDVIFFYVYDTSSGQPVFEVGGPGSLDGTAVQATIPANTLQSGKSYEAELMFMKMVDMNSTAYPWVMCAAGYYKRAYFTIQTVASPGQALGAEFEYAIPARYSMSVPRDSAVSFRFSKPMNPSFRSVTWTNVTPANFTYQWVDGNKVLLCVYNTNLPAGTDIGWSLDLSGFKDAANSNLTGSVDGSFRTFMEAPESSPDVASFSLFKMRGYRQTGAVPVATGMYGCEAYVEQTAFNRVKYGTLTIESNGRSGVLEADEWDTEMGISTTYASKNDLDRFFANGDFSFALQTLNDGDQDITLNLGVSDDYPAAPTVSNLAALQTVNPDSSLTISWTAPADWTNTILAGHTFVEVGIDNEVGDEVFWVEGFDLTSGSECVIPANTLWPGRSYRVSIYFIKIKDVDTESYPDVTGVAGFSTITELPLQTTGTVIMPTVTIQPDGGNMRLSAIGGEPQRGYVGEASTDLIRWLPLTDLWIGDSSQTNLLYDSDAHYLPQRFYRLRDRLADEMVERRITIQGTVWTDSSRTTPVVGAVVGTDLDGQKTVTDESGSFFLETDSPGAGGWLEYTITVTSGRTIRNFVWVWGDQPRDQTFEMN
jgi:hypothetical protein